MIAALCAGNSTDVLVVVIITLGIVALLMFILRR